MTHQKTRKCIASGEIKPADELLRFVKTDGSHFVPDFDKKHDGRGLYVSNSKTMLHKALEKNMFIKSIHLFLQIPQNFEQQVTDLLYRQGLDGLKTAQKAGALETEPKQIEKSILQNRAAFIVQASDADNDIRLTSDNTLDVISVYTSQDLSQALGGQNTDAISVIKCDMAQKVYQHIKRYQTFIEN